MNDIKEVIRLLNDCLDDWPHAATMVCTIMNRIKKAVDILKNYQWIPISERTPEPEELFSGSYVIVCDKYGQVFPARYVKRILRGKEIIRWHEYDFRTYNGPDIVAWMSKPEKYIGGNL